MLLLLVIIPLCNAYLNNWFPVVSLTTTDFSNPQQIRILGKDFVVWKKDENLVVQDDICPHRCAPLSEGYIDKNTNNLRCSYHGWEFNEKGTCTLIPQADKELTEKNKERSCVKNYPVCEYGNMLWMNLGNNNIEPPDIKYNLQDTPVFMRELPYSLYILLENFFDPAHIPFAHHKLQSTRDKGTSINITKLTDTKNNFSILFDETNQTNARKGIMNFEMPCHYFLTVLSPRLNMLSGLHIFMIPIQEDKTRIFIKYKVNKNTRAYKLFSKIPLWIQHMFTNKFLDSDTLILHKQEQYLIKRNNSYHFNKEYYMPTQSDKAIGLYKKWVFKHLPQIPYFYHIKNNHELGRKDILNRYEQHTKHCKFCKRALKNCKILQRVGTVVLGKVFSSRKKPFYLVFALLNYYFFHKLMKQFVFQDYIHNDID